MVAQAALQPDEPVPDDCCWYRVLTNKSHVTSEGTVHYQALKGLAFKASVEKPWAHELSGRLVSLVNDALAEAHAQVAVIHQNFRRQGKPVPSKICLAGVACATAQELRGTSSPVIRTDAIYTPQATDMAHSDFVTYGTESDADIDPVRDRLRASLHVIQPTDIATKLTSCGK